ncbi:MAG: PEP-utilizing enzyme [Patescibacteria group bacterium]|jgi:phosphohistidine swiveling domain-containing protein
MKLDDFIGKDYYIEHIDAKPLYVWPTAYIFTMPFYEEIKSYNSVVAHYDQGILNWLTLKRDIKKVFHSLIAQDRKKKNFLGELYSQWKSRWPEMMERYYRLFNCDFSCLDDLKLLELFREHSHFYAKDLKFPSFIDAYMLYADGEIYRLINKYYKNHKTEENLHETFSVLTSPIDESFLSREENELRKLAQSQTRGIDITDKVRAHQMKYSFIRGSYGDFVEYPLEEINNEIFKIIKEEDFKLKAQHVINKKRKSILLKSINFNEDILRLVGLTELFAKWQDDRKIFTLTHVALDHKFATDVARRKNIDLEIIKYCHHEELESIIKGELDVNKIAYRTQKPFVVVYKKGKVGLVESKGAKKFLNKVGYVFDNKIKELKGFTANLGRVVGPVKVINRIEDSKKVRGGDVIVIPMTRPEHYMAIKKSAAIVTDDGGITCHAAIIARELNKPCIIGTKIATKVLHDGDMVEVDADKGIVKIIN